MTYFLSRALLRAFRFSVSCAGAMASLTNSVKFYDFGRLGAGRGERVGFTEAAEQLVRHQLCGRGDTALTTVAGSRVAVASRFSPLMHGVAAEVTGYVSRC